MARDARSSGRSGLGRLIDRLLGRDIEHPPSDRAPLFTASRPPPSGRAGRAEPAHSEPAEEADGSVRSEPGLFQDRAARRPRDAWEEGPRGLRVPEPATQPAVEPPAEPAPPPEPEVDGELRTSVNEDALGQISPRARDVPGVLVHDDQLERRSGPVELTPSQAIELARGGHRALERRERE